MGPWDIIGWVVIAYILLTGLGLFILGLAKQDPREDDFQAILMWPLALILLAMGIRRSLLWLWMRTRK